MNSPETPIFTKGKVFFGLDKSKRPLLDSESAIICEGQLDLIACYMAGVQNVVAPQGTALTADHARILKRYVEEVVLCFDADNAGQNAATRSLDPLLAAGLSIRVASIPNGKDPDEFIKQHGGEAFREIVDGAEGFFDWYLKRLCATNDTKTDKGRVTVLREFGESLAKTRNAVLIDTHAQKAALRLGVSAEAVRAEFRKSRAASPRSEREDDMDRMADEANAASESAHEEAPAEPPNVRETQLLKLLLAAGEHRAVAASHLDLKWLKSPAVRRIASRCVEDTEGTLPQGAAFLAEFHDDPQAQALIGTLLAEQHEVPNPEKQIVDVLTHLRNDFLTSELQRLSRELVHPDVTDERRLELLQQQQQLRAQRQQALG